jgi:hypothetical protein
MDSMKWAAPTILGAVIILSLAWYGLAGAQTMGEYGGTMAHAAGAGASAPSFSPPSVHPNPSGASKTVVVRDSEREEDDDSYSAPDQKESSDTNEHDDDWSQVK